MALQIKIAGFIIKDFILQFLLIIDLCSQAYLRVLCFSYIILRLILLKHHTIQILLATSIDNTQAYIQISDSVV